MRDRLNILLANTHYTYRQETAHWANNWGNILSTCFYTISQVIFIDVLYTNTRLLAGYSRDELLLFMFIGQISYYLMWTIHGNLDELIAAVNKGSLDSLLVRPVPSLFYITFKKIRLFSLVRDCIPPMAILTLAIHWPNLHLDLLPVFLGGIIMLLGMVCMHIMHLLASLPVFWLGESSSILELSEHIEYNVGKVIPLEGFDTRSRILFSTIIPVLITAGVATSVMLGKIDPWLSLGGVSIVTFLALITRHIAWNQALKTYTSASS